MGVLTRGVLPLALRAALGGPKTLVLSFCRTLSRLLIRSNDTKKNALNLRQGRFLLYGGEEGIRTLDTFSRIHTFQACSFSLSDTSPWSRCIA